MYKLLLPFLLLATLATAATFKLSAPTGPLTPTERKLVGKWSGARINLKWEIQRFEDRSFELAFEEIDRDDPNTIYTNYAIGQWWAKNDNYYFEWENWWGDYGDFAGVIKEPIQSVSSDQVITLTEGDKIPENIESRVADFTLSGWKHKPNHDTRHHH